MRTRWLHLLPALAVSAAPSFLSAQQPAPPQLQVAAVELSVGGRLHTQLNTTSVEGEIPSQVFFRRARLEIGVRVDERISGAIQPDFGNDGVELKDAYVQLHVSPGLNVLAGQAYRPFGLLEQTSSKRMLPVERGLRIRGADGAEIYALTSGLAYSNRDIGLQLLGAPAWAPLGLAYAAGVFRGPLHGEVGPQDSYQYAARVTARPATALRIGAGWSRRDFSSPPLAPERVPELRRGDAFEIDVEYGSFGPGLHLLAEVARGDLDPFADATFRGAQAWLAYRTRELGGLAVAVEPLLRLSHAETRAGPARLVVEGGTLVTPGINLYVGPLNRLMLNYDIWSAESDDEDARSLKAMFQLAF